MSILIVIIAMYLCWYIYRVFYREAHECEECGAWVEHAYSLCQSCDFHKEF
jgi:predicted amidophosphoribosyltransferase